MACVRYVKHSPKYGSTIDVRSMRGHDVLYEAWLRSMKDQSFRSFARALSTVPEDEKMLYANNFDPNYVARTFVIGTVMRPMKIPESLGTIEGIEDGDLVDESCIELVLLKEMGYTRWDEVKFCISTRREWKPDGLSPTKRRILEELGFFEN